MTHEPCSDPDCAVCAGEDSGQTTEQAINELIEWANERIEAVGWAVMGVLADEDTTEFAYTVGFTRTWNHPEVIITGLDPNTCQDIFRDLAKEIAEGVRYAPGPEYDDVIGEPYKVRFIEVLPEHCDERMKLARQLEPDGFEALQIVWPAADHSYTVSPEAQPILGVMT